VVGIVAITAFWHKHHRDMASLLDGTNAPSALTDPQDLSAPPALFNPGVPGLACATGGLPPKNPDDLLPAATGDRPLVGEPANLPPFPSAGARRQYGMRRRNGPDMEDMSYWRIAPPAPGLAPAPAQSGTASPGAEAVNLRDVAAFYRRAAVDAGFVPLLGPSASAPLPAAATTTFAFVPAHSAANAVPGNSLAGAGSVLTMSFKRDGSAVSVLLVFRYPIQRLR
jgi:hypothetical protein